MNDKKRILFLCTGNSCRSQMAEGLARHDFQDKVEAFSAGISPRGVDPRAAQVMLEVGIDITGHRSKHISRYEGEPFDYVITLCDNATEKCPIFFGGSRIIHIGFPDPASAASHVGDKMTSFRNVRDDIRRKIKDFLDRALSE